MIAISNRLPWALDKGVPRKTVGGLVSALGPVLAATDGHWLGWDGSFDDDPMPVLTLNRRWRLPLPESVASGYYDGFANRTLWPLLHDMSQHVRLRDEWWSDYLSANERFAEAASLVAGVVRRSSGEHPCFWVHDYHLLPLPALLRRRRREAVIGFHLHVPFPPPDALAELPWADEILAGLLGADVIGVQTEHDRASLLDALDAHPWATEIEESVVAIEGGRRCLVEVFPASIDAAAQHVRARSVEVAAHVTAMFPEQRDRTVLLGVDRLDYTKGIPERLLAFARLLERRPSLVDELTLVQLAVPTRDGLPQYRALKRRVQGLVDEINARHRARRPDPVVVYRYGVESADRLAALYRRADIALVTPLRDGMNLVAKEYVVTQAALGSPGALVLSASAGAAGELTGAVDCEPGDPDSIALAIERALCLTVDDRRRRIASMARRVHAWDARAWGQAQLAALERASLAQSQPTRSPSARSRGAYA